MRGSAYSMFDRVAPGTLPDTDSPSDYFDGRWQSAKRFGVGLISAVVLLIGYWAWPFVGLHDLATDLAARDTAHLDHEVDFLRLRHSLTVQLVQAYLKIDSQAVRLGPFGNAVASAIGPSIADPLVAQIINPENFLVLLNGGSVTTEFGEVSLSGGQASLRSDQLPIATLRAAWKGWLGAEYWLDKFSLGIPVDAPPSEQFRIRMQLLQSHWKLVGIDLPQALRIRLANDLAKKLSSSK